MGCVNVSTRCHRNGGRDLSTTPSRAPSHPVPNPGLAGWPEMPVVPAGLTDSLNVRYVQESVAEGADDLCSANLGLDVVVLVAVEEKLGVRVCDEICESDEPDVRSTRFPVVNRAWRRMRKKAIHWWERRHELFDFRLLKHECTLLVAQTATEATKPDAPDFMDGEVHVADSLWKWNRRVVIPAHGQDFLRTTPVGHLQNY